MLRPDWHLIVSTILFVQLLKHLLVTYMYPHKLDLVVEQLRVADGLPLSIESTPAPRGHSLEFRINAEDPGRGYLPTPGLVALFAPPSGPGVRIDSGVESGSRVPGVFDSLVAKLIVSGATREQALARARSAPGGHQDDRGASRTCHENFLPSSGGFFRDTGRR